MDLRRLLSSHTCFAALDRQLISRDEPIRGYCSIFRIARLHAIPGHRDHCMYSLRAPSICLSSLPSSAAHLDASSAAQRLARRGERLLDVTMRCVYSLLMCIMMKAPHNACILTLDRRRRNTNDIEALPDLQALTADTLGYDSQQRPLNRKFNVQRRYLNDASCHPTMAAINASSARQWPSAVYREATGPCHAIAQRPP